MRCACRWYARSFLFLQAGQKRYPSGAPVRPWLEAQPQKVSGTHDLFARACTYPAVCVVVLAHNRVKRRSLLPTDKEICVLWHAGMVRRF